MTTPAGILYPGVSVRLIGTDGNAWNVIAAVRRGIADGVGTPEAELWSVAASMCGSYDELLHLAMTTVHVR